LTSAHFGAPFDLRKGAMLQAALCDDSHGRFNDLFAAGAAHVWQGSFLHG